MYQDMYFTIHGSYDFETGFPNPQAAEDFERECRDLFHSAGWEYKPGNQNGSSARAVCGKQELYLHPIQFSGIILQESVPEIEALLAQATTFRHIQTYGDAEYVEMSDEEYQAHLDSRREDIQKAILERFKTKRRNLFLTGDQSETIARPFIVRRLVFGRKSQPDLAAEYVQKSIEEMIADGRLTEAQTRYGRGIRTTGAIKTPPKRRER